MGGFSMFGLQHHGSHLFFGMDNDEYYDMRFDRGRSIADKDPPIARQNSRFTAKCLRNSWLLEVTSHMCRMFSAWPLQNRSGKKHSRPSGLWGVKCSWHLSDGKNIRSQIINQKYDWEWSMGLWEKTSICVVYDLIYDLLTSGHRS